MFGNKERLSYLWDMNETNTHPKVGMTIKGYTLKGFNRSAVKNYLGLPKGHRFYTALLEDNKGNRRCLQYIPPLSIWDVLLRKCKTDGMREAA